MPELEPINPLTRADSEMLKLHGEGGGELPPPKAGNLEASCPTATTTRARAKPSRSQGRGGTPWGHQAGQSPRPRRLPAPSPKPPLVAARPGCARVRGYNHRRPDELLVNCLKVEVC